MSRFATLLPQLVAWLPVTLFWAALIVGAVVDIVALRRRTSTPRAIVSIILKLLSLALVSFMFGAQREADCGGGFFAGLGLAVLLLSVSMLFDASLGSDLAERSRLAKQV